MENLPQPSESAQTVANVLVAVAGSLIPGGGVFRELLDIHLNDRIKKSQTILIEALQEKGLIVFDELTQGQKEFIIPAAYRFYEQVRLGEYEHNLRILGKLLTNGLVSETHADPGIIGRASRRLELISRSELQALALTYNAFEIYRKSDEYDKYWLCIDGHELVAAFIEQGLNLEVIEAEELLHEFSTRGLLTVGGRPSRIGGIYYYMNTAYNEVIEAAIELAN